MTIINKVTQVQVIYVYGLVDYLVIKVCKDIGWLFQM